jgi:hypothetical protein
VGTPPIAIYGLNRDVPDPDPAAPDYSVNKLTGCMVNTNGCGMYMTDNQSSNVSILFQGMIYAPSAKVDIDMRKDNSQYYYGGMIVRQFTLNTPGSATVPSPMIDLPSLVSGYQTRVIVLLTVSLCPGAGTCPAGTGTLKLRATVGISDDTGTPVASRRRITVYSWSVQR